MWQAVALALVMSVSAAAQGAPESRGPDLRDLLQARNFAMGGAFEALGYGAEAIGGNPAGMSVFKRYQLELSGAWDVPNGFGVADVAMMDSQSSELAAGISYHFVTFGATERRWAHVTTLALALPLSDLIHLGVAGRHQVIVGATNTNSVTLDAGIIVHPGQWLSVGFSGHNLIPNYNPDVTRYFVASASSMLFNQLSPAFDLRMDFNGPEARFAYQVGVEWLFSQTFPLRAGYEDDRIANHRYLSGGVGYFQEGSGVDLSYRHELGGDEGRLVALTLKLQM